MRNISPEALETAFKGVPRPGVVNFNIVGVEVKAAQCGALDVAQAAARTARVAALAASRGYARSAAIAARCGETAG